MRDLPPIFPTLTARDERVYLIKKTVNTLLASSLANEKNKLFKLDDQQVQQLRDAISNSNRFEDDEKVAFQELMSIALENKRNIRAVSATWGPEGVAMEAIEIFKTLLTEESKGTPLDFGDLNWKENV